MGTDGRFYLDILEWHHVGIAVLVQVELTAAPGKAEIESIRFGIVVVIVCIVGVLGPIGAAICAVKGRQKGRAIDQATGVGAAEIPVRGVFIREVPYHPRHCPTGYQGPAHAHFRGHVIYLDAGSVIAKSYRHTAGTTGQGIEWHTNGGHTGIKIDRGIDMTYRGRGIA